jgi:glucuronokinase
MSPMPTGRSVVATCTARAALAGNPSDGYGGAVLAVPIPDLMATVATSESTELGVRTSDPDLRRLLAATAAGYADAVGPLPAVTISASTTIPRSVGLAGSSALVVATLRSLGGWTERRWDRIGLAELALSIERDRLGIAAGLQDRLVQSVAHPVLMRFDPVSFDIVEIPAELVLWVAWHERASASSGTLHRSLRRRFEAGDTTVVETMAELAIEAERAHRAVVDGDAALLGDAMDRTFDLRASMVEIDPLQRRLVDIGRRAGSAVNSAGSGGSVIGLARDQRAVAALRTAYEAIGAGFLELTG